MNSRDILNAAKEELTSLDSHLIDVLDIKRPSTLAYAKQLAKVISKLSPLLGNMIEFSTVDLLNKRNWNGVGEWIRQDPGFPDALFKSDIIHPNPGIEIKAWFPFATEITARFKDSVTIFSQDNIDMALIAWLPENVIWGKPQIIDVLIVNGRSVAEARDTHYHRPPDYLVFEPEDTSERTANLQQTNTNGYKLQSDKCDAKAANTLVETWGPNAKRYSPAPEYQRLLRTLYGQFVYRLDTNYAKIDRIEHAEIEHFKTRVLNTVFHGMTIKKWSEILSSKDNQKLECALKTIL
ncbi:hypothetical protein B5F07_19255 [Lachnoclostridium sp. An169]|uniref:hypothetical protein n=1 Tax=Lachnoclostridium sp. An169 TaxID=1965569 RepID=UPI000B383A03|nr:hypothetical protein [Lachnoclostridium sp. An169]OUP80983.1 hypothetical protein B5F07_19255 [Lachnoclostridium sp. An169]